MDAGGVSCNNALMAVRESYSVLCVREVLSRRRHSFQASPSNTFKDSTVAQPARTTVPVCCWMMNPHAVATPAKFILLVNLRPHPPKETCCLVSASSLPSNHFNASQYALLLALAFVQTLCRLVFFLKESYLCCWVMNLYVVGTSSNFIFKSLISGLIHLKRACCIVSVSSALKLFHHFPMCFSTCLGIYINTSWASLLQCH